MSHDMHGISEKEDIEEKPLRELTKPLKEMNNIFIYLFHLFTI